MLTALLPRSHRGRVLALGALLDTVGTGIYLAVATLYFVVYVGIPAASVGVALGIANVFGLLSPMPVARITRRFGVAQVYVALLLLRGLAMTGYAVVGGYWGYLVVTCLFTSVSRAALPLLQVLVGQMEGEEHRTRTMASLRTVNNIGLTTGFLLAAGVQLLHSRPAYALLFVAAGLAFAAVAVVTVTATRGARAVEQPAPATARRPRSVYSDGRFITVAVANSVMLLHDSMLFILIPLWVVQRCGLSPTASSVLLMLNTLLTVLLQVRLARYAKGIRGSLRLLGWSVAALTTACLLLGATGPGTAWVVVVWLALAVALLTVGENLHAVAGWELSFLLSNPQLRAQYLSLFSLGYTGQLIVGPVLMTSVVLPKGRPGLLLMAGLFVLAAAVTAVAARARTPDHEPEVVSS